MEHLPKKNRLPRETADVLKEWILQGVLAGRLPGELRLKQRLCVGRDTLRLALDILEEEGWIGLAVKGQQRQVLVSSSHPQAAAAPGDKLLPVTLLSPFPIAHRQTLVELEETQTRLAAHGRRLLFASPEVFHLAHPGRHLERLVQSMPSAAWLLFATSQSVQEWFAQSGLPTFLYELPFPGVDLPYVACDWGASAFHAGIQLLRHGHRRLGILEYEERRPGLIADEEGLQKAIVACPDHAELLVFKDDLTPAGVARSLEKAFGMGKRPTALILTRTAQVLTCYSWLANRGIRIPKDVSMVSLPNDTWFSDLCPPLCHYAPDPAFISRKIAERVMELVDTGKVTQKSILAPLNYVSGGTISRTP
jgi:DNA-binding LacI/PurR family transcriptional regulator